MKGEDTNQATRWLKSIPGEALMILGLAETLPATDVQGQWMMIIFSAIAAFCLRLYAGIPGRLRRVGPGLVIYSIAVSFQAVLYGLALFGVQLGLSINSVVFTGAGILISLIISAALDPDEDYDKAKNEFAVAVSEAGNQPPNIPKIMKHLKDAQVLDHYYIDQKRLRGLDSFTTLYGDQSFKDYYDKEVPPRPKTVLG